MIKFWVFPLIREELFEWENQWIIYWFYFEKGDYLWSYDWYHFWHIEVRRGYPIRTSSKYRNLVRNLVPAFSHNVPINASLDNETLVNQPINQSINVSNNSNMNLKFDLNFFLFHNSKSLITKIQVLWKIKIWLIFIKELNKIWPNFRIPKNTFKNWIIILIMTWKPLVIQRKFLSFSTFWFVLLL